MKKILFLFTFSFLACFVSFAQTNCFDDDCCLSGTVWDNSLLGCVVALNGDFDGDLCVSTTDLLAFLGAFGTCQTVFSCGNSIVHAGYSYSTVTIGSQCWFQENCRYLPDVFDESDMTDASPRYYVYDYTGIDVNAAILTSNYLEYGVLYNHKAVMTPGLCPSGWHVPTDTDWLNLESSLGMSNSIANDTGWRGFDEGDELKDSQGWNNGGNGSNSSQFSALPGGHLVSSTTPGFGDLGTGGNWWTSGGIGDFSSYRRHLKFNEDRIYRDIYYKESGFSVRCIEGYGPAFIYGCMDEFESCNYNCLANTDDGSCLYINDECDDDDDTTTDDTIGDDCLCTGLPGIYGCTAFGNCNYDSNATIDDGSCEWWEDMCGIPCGSTVIPTTDCDCFGNVLDDCGICGGDNSTCFTGCGDGIMHEGYDYETVLIGSQCWFAENCRYLPIVNDAGDNPETTPSYHVYGFAGGTTQAAEQTANYITYGVLYNYPAVMTGDICPTGWHIPSMPEWNDLVTTVGGMSTAGLHLKSTTWGSGLDSYGFTALPGGVSLISLDYYDLNNACFFRSTSTPNAAFTGTLIHLFNADHIHYDSLGDAQGHSARCLQD